MNAVEYANEFDRAWFKQHPHAKCFLRPVFSGEFGMLNTKIVAGGIRHVLVVQIFEGARVRQPIKIYLDHDGLPSELRWVDTGEAWRIRSNGEIVPKRGSRPAWKALLADDTRQMAEAFEGGRP